MSDDLARALPVAASSPPRRLARPLARAQVAGVATGLGEHLGVSPAVLRAVFVVLASWQLIGAVAYLVLWLVIPPARMTPDAAGVDAATRGGLRTAAPTPASTAPDLGQLVAFGALGVGLLGVVQVLGWGMVPLWGLVGALAIGSATLVWWQADRAQGTDSEAARGWEGWVRALRAHWTTVLAHGVALLALGGAITLVLLQLPALGAVGSVVAALAMLAVGLAILAAPWVLRTRRALAGVREEKLLSDARADMAAHLHDSVLQTLALIQKQSSDPREVARLARRQERELREWLYGTSEQAETLRAGLLEAALEVEDDFDVTVECVTVGQDAPLSPALAELVKAAREAMTNAAKHSGAPLVDVYAEVGDELVEVFVRDRGRGFDPAMIAEDRMGVRGSILDRMSRHHGSATIRSHPERGTEVILEMRR